MKEETLKISTNLIYFSPTKTTKKVVEAISTGIGAGDIKHFDLTLPKPINSSISIAEDGLAIIGVPVYSGRVPVEAVRRLKRLKGSNTPAIIVAVYGNRAYEDALVELRDLVTELGFHPFAAAAFIGEHSYSTTEKPIAQNRPDAEDLLLAQSFGAKIREMLKNGNSIGSLNNLPGNVPFKTIPVRPPISPTTIEAECNKCGICVSVCPTEAIEMKDVMETDITACILCCACVKECPTGARVNESDFIKTISQRLFDNCSERKEPELFLKG
jgi:ferredoxin